MSAPLQLRRQQQFGGSRLWARSAASDSSRTQRLLLERVVEIAPRSSGSDPRSRCRRCALHGAVPWRAPLSGSMAPAASRPPHRRRNWSSSRAAHARAGRGIARHDQGRRGVPACAAQSAGSERWSRRAVGGAEVQCLERCRQGRAPRRATMASSRSANGALGGTEEEERPGQGGPLAAPNASPAPRCRSCITASTAIVMARFFVPIGDGAIPRVAARLIFRAGGFAHAIGGVPDQPARGSRKARVMGPIAQ